MIFGHKEDELTQVSKKILEGDLDKGSDDEKKETDKETSTKKNKEDQ